MGTDRLSFFTLSLYLDMTDLAESREDDPVRYHIDIGQDQITTSRANEDIITLRANAASEIVTEKDRKRTDMVIIGAESGIGYSKADAVIIHHSLKIQSFVRSFEVKKTCYGGIAVLHTTKEYVKSHPEREVLIIISNIARYGLVSEGEVARDVDAVAMMITQSSHILPVEDNSVFLTEDIYDFQRLDCSESPVVDEPLSSFTCIKSFQEVWDRHKELSGRGLEDYRAIAFHIPYMKVEKRVLQSVLDQADEGNQERLLARCEESIRYSRRIGDLYIDSLRFGLTSLLENSESLQSGDHVGLFSYGSGAVSEFSIGYLEENYQEYLFAQPHQEMLDSRKRISVDEYEMIFSESLPKHGENAECTLDIPFSVTKIENDIRYYRI